MFQVDEFRLRILTLYFRYNPLICHQKTWISSNSSVFTLKKAYCWTDNFFIFLVIINQIQNWTIFLLYFRSFWRYIVESDPKFTQNWTQQSWTPMNGVWFLNDDLYLVETLYSVTLIFNASDLRIAFKLSFLKNLWIEYNLDEILLFGWVPFSETKTTCGGTPMQRLQKLPPKFNLVA